MKRPTVCERCNGARSKVTLRNPDGSPVPGSEFHLYLVDVEGRRERWCGKCLALARLFDDDVRGVLLESGKVVTLARWREAKRKE